MPPQSMEDLLQQLRASRLLDEGQLTAVTRDLVPVLPDPHGLIRDLVLRNWLTAAQGNLLAQGRGHELNAPAATPLITAPTLTLQESGRRWLLAAILGGTAMLILLIALIARRKPEQKTPDEAPWPNDLDSLAGVTQTREREGKFIGKNTQGEQVVLVEGVFIFNNEIRVNRIVVREGSRKKEYDDMDDVPRLHRYIAQRLHELGRREVFGTWGK